MVVVVVVVVVVVLVLVVALVLVGVVELGVVELGVVVVSPCGVVVLVVEGGGVAHARVKGTSQRLLKLFFD